MDEIVSNTYPSLLDNYNNETYLQSRAIMANRIEMVNEINEYIISTIPGKNMKFVNGLKKFKI